MDDIDRIRQNVQAVPYGELVANIREATSGDEIDAEGQALTTDLLRDAMYSLRKQAMVDTDEVLYLLHPAQMEEWRANRELLYGGQGAHDVTDGWHSVDGVPMLVDTRLPQAVVYVVDPNALTMAGTVMRPSHVVRLTGLKHPAADGE